jgi:hypothetical protein
MITKIDDCKIKHQPNTAILKTIMKKKTCQNFSMKIFFLEYKKK